MQDKPEYFHGPLCINSSRTLFFYIKKENFFNFLLFLADCDKSLRLIILFNYLKQIHQNHHS